MSKTQNVYQPKREKVNKTSGELWMSTQQCYSSVSDSQHYQVKQKISLQMY